MAAFRQASTSLLVFALCCVAAACVVPHNIGDAERCADMMRRAYPSAAIEITKSEATAASLTTIIAKAEGVRPICRPARRSPAIWQSSAGLTRVF